MIVSDLKNTERQAFMMPGLLKALEFLRRPGLKALPDGKYEIDGDLVFAMVQRYTTAAAPEPKFEAHRKYADVQFIVYGAEAVGWAPLDRMTVTQAYEDEKDICFGTVQAGGWAPVRLEAGQLVVLYPEDAHAPKLAAGEPAPVMKIVVKVRVRLKC